MEQPTQLVSSEEAKHMIQSFRDFFIRDVLLVNVEHLDALEKHVH